MTKAITITYGYSRMIIASLIIAIVALITFYGLFIHQAIVNVVARENIDTQVARLSTKVGDLQFAYVDEQNKVNMDLAYSLGYQDVKNATYLSRSNTVSLLSDNSRQ